MQSMEQHHFMVCLPSAQLSELVQNTLRVRTKLLLELKVSGGNSARELREEYQHNLLIKLKLNVAALLLNP